MCCPVFLVIRCPKGKPTRPWAVQVLYVRIRPSPGPVSPPLATKQSSRLEALLDALCARLYEVENRWADGRGSLAAADFYYRMWKVDVYLSIHCVCLPSED